MFEFGTSLGRDRASARKAARAFTLIEMLVVMGIIAIVMGIGIPSFVRVAKKSPLRQAVSDIQEGLANARSQAIVHGVSAEFVLVAEDGRMFVQRLSDNESGSAIAADGGGISNWGMSAFSAVLSEEIGVELVHVNFHDRMESPEVRVRFHPNGTCDEFAIVLKSLEGERRLIKTDVITGHYLMETDPRKFMQL